MQDGVVADGEVIYYAHVRARERVERYAVVYPRPLPNDDRGAIVRAYRRTLLQPGVCPDHASPTSRTNFLMSAPRLSAVRSTPG